MANNEFKTSLLNDFNCFSMAQGYFKAGLKDKIGCFDLFFRHVPDNGGFAVCCGLQTAIDYIENLKFSDDDIEFLRDNGNFCEEFLDYLKNFKFTSSIWAVQEGTPVFAKEPIVKVIGPMMGKVIVAEVFCACLSSSR